MILFIATLSPALLDLFLSSDTRICSIMAFPLLGNSDLVVVYVVVMLFFGRIFLISVSATASEFCDWVQIGIDVYVSLIISIRSNLTHLHGFQQLVLLS